MSGGGGLPALDLSWVALRTSSVKGSLNEHSTVYGTSTTGTLILMKLPSSVPTPALQHANPALHGTTTCRPPTPPNTHTRTEGR